MFFFVTKAILKKETKKEEYYQYKKAEQPYVKSSSLFCIQFVSYYFTIVAWTYNSHTEQTKNSMAKFEKKIRKIKIW